MSARNPEGGLDWGVLSSFMELEGLTTPLKLDVLEKAVLVERLVARRQSELIEKKMREKGKPS